ncbi:MAG: hypothetical protein WCS46_07380, partial [Bacteroidales bacterium]
RQGLKIACLEEIALRNGWRTPQQLREDAAPMQHNEYGQYILELAADSAADSARSGASSSSCRAT